MSAETRDADITRHELALRRRDLLVERLGWTVDALERKGRSYTDLVADVAALLPDLPSRSASQVGVDLRMAVLVVATLGLGLGLRVLRERRERSRAHATCERALWWFVAPDQAPMLAWRVVRAALRSERRRSRQGVTVWRDGPRPLANQRVNDGGTVPAQTSGARVDRDLIANHQGRCHHEAEQREVQGL